ncbi:hypothetical protein Bbelb_372760 [Branchiostoma belcheri]|nr:hypothetical protein Bbelb_372760 [Branchiostoma belcheri]
MRVIGMANMRIVVEMYAFTNFKAARSKKVPRLFVTPSPTTYNTVRNDIVQTGVSAAYVIPIQDIVREAAGYLPGVCRRTTNKGDKMPLKETFNCDHNNRCPADSRARREPAGATSPTGTGAIGTEA